MISRYPYSMRLLHWSMAALMVSMLCAGLLMVRSLEPWQLTLLNMHKSFGLVAALLIVVRTVNRLRLKLPTPSEPQNRYQSAVANTVHRLLYALMFLMPLTGLLMQYAAARPVDVFGAFRLPAAELTDIQQFAVFRELHGLLAVVFMGIIALHIAGACHHYLSARRR
ncbi:cytochrome b [Idiomarina aquatica]|uniref:Cytochrome B n=1 Tax=Idiomarina aquatica TaxID=1327752 RepID=A0AA94EGA3_9GAMM|nr:cytochrome b [Idiomarina aquatica]RUO44712.1 cytochrome B [Idiomarina aquatica]